MVWTPAGARASSTRRTNSALIASCFASGSDRPSGANETPLVSNTAATASRRSSCCSGEAAPPRADRASRRASAAASMSGETVATSLETHSFSFIDSSALLMAVHCLVAFLFWSAAVVWPGRTHRFFTSSKTNLWRQPVPVAIHALFSARTIPPVLMN